MGKKSKTKDKKLGKADTVIKTLVAELFQKCVSPTSTNNPTPKELFDAMKEIFEMLENVEKLKDVKGAVSQLPNREDSMEDFYSWAKERKILFENIEIKGAGPGELGVFASKDFSEGERFITIPREAMMTSDSLAESKIAQLIRSDPMLSTMQNVSLSLHLLCELYNEKSIWKNYINILPRNYSNILYFGIDDLQNLKGTSMFMDAINVVRSIIRQYAYLSNLFYKHPLGKELDLTAKFTYADYKWAVATLMTRQNPIPPKNGSEYPVLALIPLLDMCNHREGPVSVDYNPEAKHCECFVAGSIRAGEELFIHYGPRPNSELAMYNGFFYKENTHDFIKMKFGFSRTDPSYDSKITLGKKLNIEDFLPIGCMPLPIKDSLGAFLQIANASEEEVAEMLKLETVDLAKSLKEGNLTTRETKMKGLKSLRDRCSLAWKIIPGEDKEEINTDASRTKILSKLLRENEKRLLDNMVQYIDSELIKLAI